MWWAGRTGTLRWTTSGDQTGSKTTWTAPSSWTHSGTSSTSSRRSTAWPTSGSVCSQPRRFQPSRHAHGTISAVRSKFLWAGSQRVGVSSNQKTDLGYSAFIRPDGSVVLIVLNRCVFRCLWDLLGTNVRLFCRSPSAVPFEAWDPSVGYVPATAPARSLLTLAWRTV